MKFASDMKLSSVLRKVFGNHLLLATIKMATSLEGELVESNFVPTVK